MKVKEIDIPIYFGTLIIILTDSLEKLNPIYNTNIKEELYDAGVFQPIDTDKYIVAIKKVEWSIIVHETVHLVNDIFLSRGIELDRINDEPQAYFTGWVISEINKFIEGNNG